MGGQGDIPAAVAAMAKIREKLGVDLIAALATSIAELRACGLDPSA